MTAENARKKLTDAELQELRKIAAAEWPPQGKGELLNALTAAVAEIDALRKKVAALETAGDVLRNLAARPTIAWAVREWEAAKGKP